MTRVVAGSTLLALLAAGTYGLLLLSMSDLRSANAVQARSRNVTSATLGLQQVVNELELSLRAYVTTRRRAFPRLLAPGARRSAARARHARPDDQL